MDCGSFRAPSHDDNRRADGGNRLGGAGLDFKPWPVLFFLLLQRTRLRLWGAASQPGPIDAVVRSIPRQSDGLRLSRNRLRRSIGTVDLARARPALRMADGVAAVGAPDCSRLVPAGSDGERAIESENNCRFGHIAGSEVGIQTTVLLPAYAGKYVLDCGSQRHSTEFEAIVESRSTLHAEGCRKCPIAGTGLQYCRPVAHRLVS